MAFVWSIYDRVSDVIGGGCRRHCASDRACGRVILPHGRCPSFDL